MNTPGNPTRNAPAAFAQELRDVAGIDAAPHHDPTTVYAYFRNNGDLVQALWWSALNDFDRRVQDAFRAADDPIQPLKAVGAAYARFALENPARFRDLFNLDTGRLAAELNADLSRESTYTLFLQMVKEAASEKNLCLRDPELIAQILWAAIHGIFSLVHSWPDFPFRPSSLLVSTMMDIMLAGVLAMEPD